MIGFAFCRTAGGRDCEKEKGGEKRKKMLAMIGLVLLSKRSEGKICIYNRRERERRR